jgi:hypothetical protein
MLETWIGLGIFLWGLGFLPRIFSQDLSEEETLQIPKLVSIICLAPSLKVSRPSLGFQSYGFIMILYGLISNILNLEGLLDIIMGFVFPAIVTRALFEIIESLQNK